MKFRSLAVALLLVVSAAGAAAAVPTASTQESQGEAYAGTYVEFETTTNAVVDYTVNGQTVVESMRVQSKERAESQSGGVVDIDAGGSVGFSGAGLSLASKTAAQATITTESGATMRTHDNDRGIVVVSSGGTAQYVHANVSDGAEVEQSGESRVVVTRDDGTTATFIVVGEGNVSASGEGNVTARLAQDGKLVYRQYEGERSESEQSQERMIANGTAVAEVYYQGAAESGSDAGDDGQDRTADVVQYSEETTIEVQERSNSTFEYTVERSQSEGKVVITSVSEQAMDAGEDLRVTVDGEAAVEASSYSEVVAATEGGDTSKYLVRQSTSAQASSDVVVGVNHFSERTVALTSDDEGGDGGDGATATPDGDGDDADGGSGDDQQTPSGEGTGPGFGVAVSVLALLGAALLARARP